MNDQVSVNKTSTMVFQEKNSMFQEQIGQKTTKRLKKECPFCGKLITSQNLGKHQTVCQLNDKRNRLPKFICPKCNRNYSRKETLNFHVVSCTGKPFIKSQLKCLDDGCYQYFNSKVSLIDHLKRIHDWELGTPELKYFETIEEFEKWKILEEEKTFSYFSRQSGSHGGRTYYHCQHDGKAKPHRRQSEEGRKTSRKVKIGRIKNDKICISMIHLYIKDDGSCNVKYFPTHNHPLLASDIKHQPRRKAIMDQIDDQVALSNISTTPTKSSGEQYCHEQLDTTNVITRKEQMLKEMENDFSTMVRFLRSSNETENLIKFLSSALDEVWKKCMLLHNSHANIQELTPEITCRLSKSSIGNQHKKIKLSPLKKIPIPNELLEITEVTRFEYDFELE